MNSAELRNNFHHLIDNMKDDYMLSKFYEIMNFAYSKAGGNLWDGLSKDEQEELIRSDIESSHPDNLISHSEMLKKHKRWL